MHVCVGFLACVTTVFSTRQKEVVRLTDRERDEDWKHDRVMHDPDGWSRWSR